MTDEQNRRSSGERLISSQEAKQIRKRNRATPRQITEFSEAKALAQSSGFNLDFLNPVGLEPELTEAAKPLALAITASVNQGKQHGAAFFARIEASNPDMLSEADKQSIIARHNWEAAQKPRRPKLSRQIKAKPSDPQSGQGGKGFAQSNENLNEMAADPTPQADPKIQPTRAETDLENTAVSELFVENYPSKYGEDPHLQHASLAPELPDKPSFKWKKENEELANKFFQNIHFDKPIHEVVAAANALKADSAAVANVRYRGPAEAEYLDEAFRKLGLT